MEEAARALNVSEATVRRLIQEKILPATHHCKGTPWVIRADDLNGATVRQAADVRRQRRPPSDDPRQNSLGL
jgi:excisionase family DNA binding protein